MAYLCWHVFWYILWIIPLSAGPTGWFLGVVVCVTAQCENRELLVSWPPVNDTKRCLHMLFMSAVWELFLQLLQCLTRLACLLSEVTLHFSASWSFLHSFVTKMFHECLWHVQDSNEYRVQRYQCVLGWCMFVI